ncbi:MAG: type II toxin-antitoxin system CcdA family antitoxin [Gammaproteobacteria bacterium]|nr:type II toxin-antitoxin system CcdA family antitoxin [Gammaproteobacteria bacterium]
MSKRPTNVSISSELLDQARELDVNLSATLEQALTELVRRRRREQWVAENREAIAAYNSHVEESGVFSDGLRSF